MDTNISEKIIEAIRLSMKNSNPFEKSNVFMKRVSLMVFLTFGFTVLNYLMLKNVAETQQIIKDKLNQIENKREKQSTSEAKANSPSPLQIIDTDDEILDECYDIIPCSNLKKTTSPKYLFF